MAAVGPCYSSDSCARSHTAKFCKFASELQIHERLTRRQGALTIEIVSLSCLRTRQLASHTGTETLLIPILEFGELHGAQCPCKIFYPFPQQKFPFKPSTQPRGFLPEAKIVNKQRQ